MPRAEVGSQTTANCPGLSAVEQAAVLNETANMLAAPAFRGSKRCQSLLRHLVDRTLAGDRDAIKERTLGMDVFSRSPDYDTSHDPIVRVTANDIRKRLGQYYQEPSAQPAVRIRLLPGTYVLQFDFDQSPQPTATTQPQIPEHAPVPALPRLRKRWIQASVAAAVLLGLGFLASRADVFQSRGYLVWKPLLNSPKPMTLSISDAGVLVNADIRADARWRIIADTINWREAPGASPSTHPPTTPLADADVAHKVTGWLAIHGRRTSLRPSSAVNLRDFRQGPMVLIGAFNPWALIMLSGLRYSIRVDPVTHAKWIQDFRDPGKRDWSTDGNLDHPDRDYAVVSRFVDTETGEWILAMGGLWPYGTEAAADLLTDDVFLKSIPGNLGSKGNFQIVLTTSVINGNAGPPRVLATYTW